MRRSRLPSRIGRAGAERVAYGFIGVGAIAAAMVEGLCAGVSDPPAILLSPRDAGIAAALAGRHACPSVARDNQAVVDGADVRAARSRPRARRW